MFTLSYSATNLEVENKFKLLTIALHLPMQKVSALVILGIKVLVQYCSRIYIAHLKSRRGSRKP